MTALIVMTVEQSFSFFVRDYNNVVFTDQADENTASMQRLLKVKVEQLQDLATQLETLKTGTYTMSFLSDMLKFI